MKPVHIISILATAGFIVIGGATLVYHRLATAGAESFLGRGGYYAINSKANAEYSSGNYQSAIADYGRMIAMNPNKTDAYLLRAFAYRKMRMYTRAVADDTRALQLLNTPEGVQELGFPDSTPQFKKNHLSEAKAGLYVNRGLAYQDMGDHVHAIADFTAGIAIYPAIGEAYGARALSLYSVGQYAKALPDADKDVSAEPNVWHAYLTRDRSWRSFVSQSWRSRICRRLLR